MARTAITNFQISVLNVVSRIDLQERYRQGQWVSGGVRIEHVWVSATGIANALGYKRASAYHLGLMTELVKMGYLSKSNHEGKNIYKLTDVGRVYVNNLVRQGDIVAFHYQPTILER